MLGRQDLPILYGDYFELRTHVDGITVLMSSCALLFRLLFGLQSTLEISKSEFILHY